MTNIEPNYEGFADFFSRNRIEADSKFRHPHLDFEKHFDEALGNLHSNKGDQGSIAISILLRAIKYLYTAENLLLDGHQEESRILLRNVVELGLLGFLMSKSEEVFNLWKECQELRKNSEKDGRVPYESVKRKKFAFSEIVRRNKNLITDDHRASGLYAYRKELSENVSHESIYSMIARFDSKEQKTEVYVGQSAKSSNHRIDDDLQRINQLLIIIKDLKSECE